MFWSKRCMPRYDDDEELRELHEKLKGCFDQKPNQNTNQNKNRFEGETVEMFERKGTNGKTIYEPINDTNNNYYENKETHNVEKYDNENKTNKSSIWRKIGIVALVSAIATFVSTYLIIKTTGFILKHWKEIGVLLIGSAIIANSSGGCSIIDIEEPKKKSYSQHHSEVYNDASKKMESLVENKKIKIKYLNKLNNPKTL